MQILKVKNLSKTKDFEKRLANGGGNFSTI